MLRTFQVCAAPNEHIAPVLLQYIKADAVQLVCFTHFSIILTIKISLGQCWKSPDIFY